MAEIKEANNTKCWQKAEQPELLDFGGEDVSR